MSERRVADPAFCRQTEAKEYTQETLDLTARVLGLNPEYQTGWGVRRRVLVEGLFPSLCVCSSLYPSMI